MMISLRSIYTIFFLVKSVRSVMQNGNIKTIMAFCFTSIPSILTPCTIYHDLEVFQTKQEGIHETKQHAGSA